MLLEKSRTEEIIYDRGSKGRGRAEDIGYPESKKKGGEHNV